MVEALRCYVCGSVVIEIDDIEIMEIDGIDCDCCGEMYYIFRDDDDENGFYLERIL